MKFIRFGICALVAFSVLAHGVVEPWSEAVIEVGAAILTLVWAWQVAFDTRSRPVWNPLMWPLLGLWLVVALQLMTGATSVPFLTRTEFLEYTALVSLFILAIQSFRTQDHWRGFVWFLLTLGFAVSLFAIVQHFTFNGKLYWFRELRFGGVPFGPYVNRNHFAGLMELLIPPGLAILVLQSERRDLLPLVSLFTLIPIGALFLSASRGGITSFFAEIGLLATLIVLRHGERKELAAAAAVLILASVLVSWLGIGRALDRFASYRSLEVGEGRRIEMLYGSWRIFLDHPVAGTGLGTLQDVYPLYQTIDDGSVVNHTHNDYVETLAETGVIGGLCGLAFLILLARIGWKTLLAVREIPNVAYHTGALVACFGLLVHAMVDFNFHIPSNLLIFLLQAALATSLALPSPSSSRE
jgi:O-antigen ligase